VLAAVDFCDSQLHILSTRRRVRHKTGIRCGIARSAAGYRRVAASGGAALRHRQRSATDEQRGNDHKTFHFYLRTWAALTLTCTRKRLCEWYVNSELIKWLQGAGLAEFKDQAARGEIYSSDGKIVWTKSHLQRAERIQREQRLDGHRLLAKLGLKGRW
jgi:hypothetical protein